MLRLNSIMAAKEFSVFFDRIGWTCRSFVRVLILDCLLEAVFHIRDSCEGPKLSTKKFLCPSHHRLKANLDGETNLKIKSCAGFSPA